MSQTAVSTNDALTSGSPGQDRHPKGLYILFASEMWERFGFYTAAAMMTLYLQRGGFNWSTTQATSLWSNYLMFVYATPLIGGWLADRFLGYRRAVIAGGVFFFAGYLMLGLGSIGTFYLALGLIFAGNGFFKPNVSTMVGNLYPSNSPLKDSAYSIFYMGINVGALLRRSSPRGRCNFSLVLRCWIWPRKVSRCRRSRPRVCEPAFSPRSTRLQRYDDWDSTSTVLLSKVGGCRSPPCPAHGGRFTSGLGHRGRPTGRVEAFGDRSGARIDADYCPAGCLWDRDRVLDGVSPKWDVR